MALPNYVKFLRGSLTAYNRLAVKDENTLYFIYDAEDNTKGTLYLGTRLIGSVGGSGGVSNLSELADVIVSGANTGDFLVLNSEGKWTSISAANVAQAIVEAGGNFVDIDENQFLFNAVNGKLELKGYSSATNGLVPVKSSNGLSWAAMPPDLSTRVGDLENELNSVNTAVSAIQTDLLAVDGKISLAILNANHLTYRVVNDLASATAENVIYLYANGATSGNNIYNEYLLTNGNLERIGSTDIDLSLYVTTSSFNSLNTRVGDLETSMSSLQTAVNNLNAITGDYVLLSTFNAVVGDLSTVNSVYNNLNTDDSIAETLIDIYDRLTWQELN